MPQFQRHRPRGDLFVVRPAKNVSPARKFEFSECARGARQHGAAAVQSV
jgi:hypothetical protein